MTTKITEKNISSLANAGVNWQPVVVADGSTGTTGVAGRGYFINTTSAAHTFTLPATATFADTILIKDYAGTFASNKLTINRNGHNIQGVANNSLISTNRASITLVYVDVTRGWEYVTESNVADLQAASFISATGGTVTTSGDFKIHTFTGDGCFVVSQVGNPVGGGSNVDYLVVAGGGGSGGNRFHIQGGGGGGAGGFREGRVLPAPESYTASPLVAPGGLPVSAQTYPITVGAGGAAGGEGGGPGLTDGPAAGSGSNSIFSTITSAGGGAGGQPSAGTTTPQNGVDGGSGGGGGGGSPQKTGGTGNSPPTSPAQGSNGGAGSNVNQTLGGSGGGATGAGSISPGCSPPPSTPSRGAGATTAISGSPTLYSRGGSYSHYNPAALDNSCTGAINSGNGGDAQNAAPAPISPAAGPTNYTGKAGGSGIVVIRYKFQ